MPLTTLRTGMRRLTAAAGVTLLMGAAAPVQAHEGPHDAAPMALLMHAFTASDHLAVSLLMLSVAAVLALGGVRLWMTSAQTVSPRMLGSACLGAAGLIVWSVWHVGLSLTA
jgi:hypothetical protein